MCVILLQEPTITAVSYTHLDVYKRQVKGCTKRDHIRNVHIRMELGIAKSLNEKFSQYTTVWRLQLERMGPTRFLRRAFDSSSRENRSVRRPRKRWLLA